MIDKSIRQHYENGKEVDPYRKGLEIIAGKGKGTFQTTAPAKITAKSLIQPARKMTLPSVKASGTAPFIRTLPTIAQPSLDSAQYSGLANILPKTEEGSYLDKYIDKYKDPIRIARGVEGEADSDYLTSSLVETDKALTTQDTLPGTDIATLQDTFPGIDIATTLDALPTKGETATSYNDTQMQDIFKSGDQETKNFITSTSNKVTEWMKNNEIVKTGGKVAKDYLINTVVKSAVAKQLGIGSLFGPIGMIFGWIFDKVREKITGEEVKSPVDFLINNLGPDGKDDGKDKDEIPPFGPTVAGPFKYLQPDKPDKPDKPTTTTTTTERPEGMPEHLAYTAPTPTGTSGAPGGGDPGMRSAPSAPTGGPPGGGDPGMRGGGNGGGNCFVKGTPITMADGSTKPVEQVDLGDKVAEGGKVFAAGKFLTEELYDYEGIKVSGSHMVNEEGTWVRVRDSEKGKPLGDDEHTVHVFGAENRRILINGILFTDYFEVKEQDQLATIGDKYFEEWKDPDKIFVGLEEKHNVAVLNS